MIDWLASKILILDFQKISKSWNLAYLRIFWAQKQCSKLQNFGLRTKKLLRLKNAPKLPDPLSFVNFYLTKPTLRCHNFWTGYLVCGKIFRIILYIPFICKSFIKIWHGSCFNLWNFGPIDMEWPNSKVTAPIEVL